MIITNMKINTLDILNTLDNGYLVYKVEGLQNPESRLPAIDLPNQHGAFLQGNLYARRNIFVAIMIVGTTETDYAEKREELLKELNIDIETDSKIPLEFTRRGDGLNLRVLGMPKAVKDEMTFNQVSHGIISFEFECYDPALYETTQNSESIYMREITGGMSLPASLPGALGTISGDGLEVCTNGGNFKTYPNLMITGIVVNPIIKNNYTGEEIQFNVENTLPSDYISVDMKNKKATQTSGTTTTNIISDLDSVKNDFWGLDPGNNEIEFDHEGTYNANTYCTVSWRDAYIGI